MGSQDTRVREVIERYVAGGSLTPTRGASGCVGTG